MALFVGRLPPSIRTVEVEELFYKYGRINRCDVKRGSSYSYGFVEFYDRRDAEDALRECDGMRISGCRIVVELAKGNQRRGDERNCFKCGKEGHWARDCIERRRKKSRSRSRHHRHRSSRSRSRSDSRSPPKRRNKSRRKSRSRSASPRLKSSSHHRRSRDEGSRRDRSRSSRSRSRSGSRSRGSRSRSPASDVEKRGRSRSPRSRSPIEELKRVTQDEDEEVRDRSISPAAEEN